MSRGDNDGADLSATTGGQVLVVDDEPGMVQLLVESLTDAGFEVVGHTDPQAALEAVHALDFDAVLTDIRMRGWNGHELCREILRVRPDVPVIIYTAFGNMEAAVEALRSGAWDFLSKPVDLDALELALRRAVRHHRLTQEVHRLRQLTEETPPALEEMLGQSAPMRRLATRLQKAANADAPVLLTGETGTGKELAARALHRASHRAGAPFVAVNCAALPEALLESELFGHTKGAFTDAREARRGLFVEAGGGTLFLDEVGEMPLALQPKLLRVLQEGQVRPVGADRSVPVGCRVVSATNRDLKLAVAQGGFRSDLFYRLAVIRLELPPLRHRVGDILLLAQRFLERAAARNHSEVEGLTRPVAQALLAYDWPGNVRELENCMEQGVAMTEHDHLLLDDLPDEVRSAAAQARAAAGEDNLMDTGALLPLEAMARKYIERVLESVGGNKSLAAQILGVDRSTLYRKMDKSA